MVTFKEKIKGHWLNYCGIYVCMGIFICSVIIIAALSYCLIIKPVHKEIHQNSTPAAVKVFINQNDSIMPQIQSDIQELKGLIEEMQNDALHVMITKGSEK